MNKQLRFWVQPKLRVFRLVFLAMLAVVNAFCAICLLADKESWMAIFFVVVAVACAIAYVMLYQKKLCVDAEKKELIVKHLFRRKCVIPISEIEAFSDMGYSVKLHRRYEEDTVRFDKNWGKVNQLMELFPDDLSLRSVRIIPNSQRFIVRTGWFEAIFFIGLALIVITTEQDIAPAIIFGLLSLLGIFLLVFGKRQWMTYDRETGDIYYCSAFGRKKHFLMEDVKNYSMEMQVMILQDSMGKTLAKLSLDMINLPIFYALLNNQNDEQSAENQEKQIEQGMHAEQSNFQKNTGKEYRPKSNSSRIYENNITAPVMIIIFGFCGAMVFGCIMAVSHGTEVIMFLGLMLACILVSVMAIVIMAKHRWILLEDGLLAQTIRGEKKYFDKDLLEVHKFSTDKNGEVMEVVFRDVDALEQKNIRKYFRYTETLDIFMERNGYDIEKLNQEVVANDKEELREIYEQDGEHARKVQVVRWGTRAVSLLTIALPWIIWKVIEDGTLCYRLIMWGPLLNLIFPIIFSKLFVSDSNRNHTDEWKENHITFPYTGWLLSSLELIWFMPTINIRNWQNAVVVCVIFAAIVTGIYALATRKRGFHVGLVAIVGFVMLLIGYSSTHYIARGYRSQTPVHEQVIVSDLTYSRSKNSTDYYAEVKRQGGTIEKLDVTNSTYKSLKKGSVAILCKNESVFGLEYWVVHTL